MRKLFTGVSDYDCLFFYFFDFAVYDTGYL